MANDTLRWDQKLPVRQRFVVLAAFNNEAVLDKETGLVWEKSPQTAEEGWIFAILICANKTVGGRKGWRLPSMPELASLVDPSVTPGPTLPAGHPFTNVQSANYWSATSCADDPSHAWFVEFNNGNVNHDFKVVIPRQVWCVRGGMNADQY